MHNSKQFILLKRLMPITALLLQYHLANNADPYFVPFLISLAHVLIFTSFFSI